VNIDFFVFRFLYLENIYLERLRPIVGLFHVVMKQADATFLDFDGNWCRRTIRIHLAMACQVFLRGKKYYRIYEAAILFSSF